MTYYGAEKVMLKGAGLGLQLPIKSFVEYKDAASISATAANIAAEPFRPHHHQPLSASSSGRKGPEVSLMFTKNETPAKTLNYARVKIQQVN